jgi:hypothetical protein
MVTGRGKPLSFESALFILLRRTRKGKSSVEIARLHGFNWQKLKDIQSLGLIEEYEGKYRLQTAIREAILHEENKRRKKGRGPMPIEEYLKICKNFLEYQRIYLWK